VEGKQVKYLIVGLGNIGRQYSNTRHNVGFKVVEKVAGLLDVNFSDNKKLLSAVARTNGVILAKPQSYMNLSGLAVAKLKDYYEVDVNSIVVISDDFNLDLGKIRIRFDGEAGGHKGIESVMSQVGPDFWRVRIGIGKTEPQKAERYVLGKFNKDDRKIIGKSVDIAASYLVDLMSCRQLKNESLNVGLRNN